MTVQSTSSRAGPYIGNGVATTWPAPFRVDNLTDLEVVYTDPTGLETLLGPAQFSVSGLGDPAGIVVTYPLSGAPMGTDEKLSILRVVDYTQPTSITNQGGFYPQVIEKALDRIVYQVQQLAERLGRAVVVSVNSTDPEAEIEAMATNAALAQHAADEAVAAQEAAEAAAASITFPIPITSISGLGSAAEEDVGTEAGNVVALDGGAKLPAVDASQLLAIPGTFDCRQTVLRGVVDSDGMPSFLTEGTGTAVTLSASESSPVILTAANGYATNGQVDRIARLTSDRTIALTPAVAIANATAATATLTINTTVAHGRSTGDLVTLTGFTPAGYNGQRTITVTTPTQFTITYPSALGAVTVTGTYMLLNYIYGDIAADGTVTFGASLVQPIYQGGGAYSTAAGQFTFNTSEMVGKVGDGTAATQKYRVYIGEAYATATAASGALAYALKGRYRSPLQTFSAAATNIVNHNLGMVPEVFHIAYVCQVSNLGYPVGTTVWRENNAGGAQGAQGETQFANKASCGIALGAAIWLTAYSGAGTAAPITLASWRWYAICKRGW